MWSHFASSKCLSLCIAKLSETISEEVLSRRVGNVEIQTNLSRALEPICAFWCEWMENHAELLADADAKRMVDVMFEIQLIDVAYFGNEQSYLYGKAEDGDEEDTDKDNDKDDAFDRWAHHVWIRQALLPFIHANGLCAWIHRLCVGGDNALAQLWYFAVCVELLFELTERVLISVKVPSLDDAVRAEQHHQLRLVTHELAPTLSALLSVVSVAAQPAFVRICGAMASECPLSDALLLNACRICLEALSNALLISTSLSRTNKLRFQKQWLCAGEGAHANGAVMAATLSFLQRVADEMRTHRKEQRVSADAFRSEFAATIALILSFRRPLLSMAATLCDGHRFAQDLFRERALIPVLLNMTKLDGVTLFLAQWSILAIRHLTQGNEQNQRFIRQLRAQRVVHSDEREMRRMGVRVELDEKSGKLVATKTALRLVDECVRFVEQHDDDGCARKVLCFGASLTSGLHSGDRHSPYADTLRVLMERERVKCSVTESGRDGERVTGGALERLRDVFEESHFDVVIVLGGTNDLLSTGYAGSICAGLAGMYREITDVHNARCVAVTIPPMKYNSHGDGILQLRKSVNEFIRRSESESLAVCDLHQHIESLHEQERERWFDADGLHFSEYGYSALGKLLFEVL